MSEPNNRIISDCSRTNQISLMINQECVNLKKNSIFKDEESRLDAIERINSVYEDNQTLKEKVQQLLTITANIISDVGIRLDSMDYDMSKVMQERKL